MKKIVVMMMFMCGTTDYVFAQAAADSSVSRITNEAQFTSATTKESYSGAKPTATSAAMEKAKEQTERMNSRLNLSETQKQALEQANIEYATQIEDLKGANEDLRKRVDDTQSGYSGKLKSILTADQYRQYQNWRETRQERRKEVGAR